MSRTRSRLCGTRISQAILADQRLWETIEDHLDRALAGRTEEPTAIGKVRRGGILYRVRVSSLPPMPDREPVVLVAAVERRDPCFPTPEELRGRFDLTPREAEVALRLARRRTDREIAEEFGFTIHTARRHAEAVRKKLDVSRRTQLEDVVLNG